MVNGNYEFAEPRGQIGGFVNDEGDYMIGDGNNRMQAAIQILAETGDASYVQQLIDNGRWTPVSQFWTAPQPLPPVR